MSTSTSQALQKEERRESKVVQSSKQDHEKETREGENIELQTEQQAAVAMTTVVMNGTRLAIKERDLPVVVHEEGEGTAHDTVRMRLDAVTTGEEEGVGLETQITTMVSSLPEVQTGTLHERVTPTNGFTPPEAQTGEAGSTPEPYSETTPPQSRASVERVHDEGEERMTKEEERDLELEVVDHIDPDTEVAASSLLLDREEPTKPGELIHNTELINVTYMQCNMCCPLYVNASHTPSA